MADGTKIEWTDATWNPITGCSVVSPGCTNCYAMKLAGTRLQHHLSRKGLTKDSKAGPVWTGEVRFNKEWLHQPLRWAKPRMIFVCAHGDLFAEAVPDAWIDQVFAVMALAPQHTFQVLTKRPERMREYLAKPDRAFRIFDAYQKIIRFTVPEGSTFGGSEIPFLFPLLNVWLGVSVEDQKRAEERIPLLLDTPAAIRWVSAEPLLGPLDLMHLAGPRISANIIIGKNALTGFDGLGNSSPHLDWVVAGGESCAGARPMHPDWVRSLRDQCTGAGVPFLFKQWGAWKPVPWKLTRNEGETDSDYIARSEALCSQFAVSRTGHLHEMAHKPWSADRALPAPQTHHAVKPLGKRISGRLLDGVEHNAFPKPQEIAR